MKNKICVVCGKDFVAERNEKCCSLECTTKRRRETQRNFALKNGKITEQTKHCVICGKEFKTFRDKQITCSKECGYLNSLGYVKDYSISNRELINAKRRDRYQSACVSRTFTCSECGKEFASERKVKYCSDECKKKHKREYNTKYVKEKREKEKQE